MDIQKGLQKGIQKGLQKGIQKGTQKGIQKRIQKEIWGMAVFYVPDFFRRSQKCKLEKLWLDSLVYLKVSQ